MRFHYFVMAALLAGSPAAAGPVKRVPAAAAKTDPAALKAACDQLAALVTPESASASQVDGIVGAMLQTMLVKDAGFAALNTKYPGMTDAIAVRVRPLMLESARLTTPLYRAELSQLYAANFTLAEARAAVTFFSSADGQALLSSANANLTYKATSASLAQGSEASTGDLRQDARAAAQRTLETMPAVRKARVSAFFASPAGQKIIAMGPRKSELDQKWFNYAPPGLQDKVAQATVEAMLDHMAKTDPSTAKRMREALIEKGAIPKP
ncbi:MAG: DUF2059 domain-containing protein [Novosphingobium sp.]